MSNCGFTYVATGDRFKREATASCRSLKKVMPRSKVTIFTESRDGIDGTIFDDIQIMPEPKFGFYDKIYAFKHTPYERTVFIDTDTHVCEPVPELFTILDRYHLAAVRDHWSVKREECPDCFDDFNTGVVAFRRCNEVSKVVCDWESIYSRQICEKAKVDHDQPAFCVAVYQNESIQAYVLPKNYNLRLIAPIVLGIGFRPKILHGRSDQIDRIVRDMGNSSDFRVFMPNARVVERTFFGAIDASSCRLFLLGAYLARLTRLRQMFREDPKK